MNLQLNTLASAAIVVVVSAVTAFGQPGASTPIAIPSIRSQIVSPGSFQGVPFGWTSVVADVNLVAAVAGISTFVPPSTVIQDANDLYIYDVTNPELPETVVARVDISAEPALEVVALSDGILWVAGEDLRRVDVSDMENIPPYDEWAAFQTPEWLQGLRTDTFVIQDNVAYSLENQGLEIYDVSEPDRFDQVGTIDTTPPPGFRLPFQFPGFVVSADRLYISYESTNASSLDSAIAIWDIARPTDPARISETILSGSQVISRFGKMARVGDALYAVLRGPELAVLDVSDEASLVLVDVLEPFANEVAVFGEYMIARSTNAVSIYDVATPLIPQLEFVGGRFDGGNLFNLAARNSSLFIGTLGRFIPPLSQAPRAIELLSPFATDHLVIGDFITPESLRLSDHVNVASIRVRNSASVVFDNTVTTGSLSITDLSSVAVNGELTTGSLELLNGSVITQEQP